MQRFRMFFKKALCLLGTVLTVVLTVVATIICYSIKWMLDTWNNLTMDELVYHLKTPLEGTNENMIKEYLNICIVPAVLVLFFVLILFITYRNQRKYFVIMGGGIIASLVISTVVVHNAWNQLGAGEYVKAQGVYSSYIDDNYVNPSDVEIEFPEQKRNLIYIFLESMETTFSNIENGGAFEENVIPELTNLAQENEDFSGEDNKLNGGYAMPGATWTIGAMFSQTSGIPLNISIDINSMDTQDSFFNNVLTLGDILEQAGYSQTLLLGSDATFGGRRLYFSEHGNYDIEDYIYASDVGMLPEGYRVCWGYEDQKLFTFAKEKVLELAQQDTPFNLTMLTVDTHFEDGYLCDICPNTFGGDQYSNVMACSSKQVDEFIKWLQQQDFYKDTTIVIVGDHPTMDSDFCENIETDYLRRVYTCFINSVVDTDIKSRRTYATFDNFPTTLAALGVKIEGNRLGLGTNLFSNVQTLTERTGIDIEKSELNKKSKLMEDLANLDENKKELLIREGKIPSANFFTGEYQFENGALPVVINELLNIREDNIEQVMIEVWTNEDQSDLKILQMEKREDGSYFVNIDVANFGFKTGQYYVKAYVVDTTGKQYELGETIGIVE